MSRLPFVLRMQAYDEFMPRISWLFIEGKHTMTARISWRKRPGRPTQEVRAGGCVHYSKSEPVLTWLVLSEVSNIPSELPEALQHVLESAFHRVARELREGRIELDYTPPSDFMLDIPAAQDPQYMQALLYWSTKFDCTPGVLVEAHARLGRLASVAHAFLTIAGIKEEDQRSDKECGTTFCPTDMPPTLAMFAHTSPSFAALSPRK